MDRPPPWAASRCSAARARGLTAPRSTGRPSSSIWNPPRQRTRRPGPPSRTGRAAGRPGPRPPDRSPGPARRHPSGAAPPRPGRPARGPRRPRPAGPGPPAPTPGRRAPRPRRRPARRPAPPPGRGRPPPGPWPWPATPGTSTRPPRAELPQAIAQRHQLAHRRPAGRQGPEHREEAGGRAAPRIALGLALGRHPERGTSRRRPPARAAWARADSQGTSASSTSSTRSSISPGTRRPATAWTAVSVTRAAAAVGSGTSGSSARAANRRAPSPSRFARAVATASTRASPTAPWSPGRLAGRRPVAIHGAGGGGHDAAAQRQPHRTEPGCHRPRGGTARGPQAAGQPGVPGAAGSSQATISARSRRQMSRGGPDRQRFGPLVQVERRGQPARGGGPAGGRHHDPRVLLHQTGRQPVEPRLLVVGQLGAAGLDHPAHRRPVARPAVGPQGVDQPAAGLQQPRRPPGPVLGLALAVPLDQPGLQAGPEHLVVAVHRLALVEPGDEHLPGLQLRQQPGRVICSRRSSHSAGVSRPSTAVSTRNDRSSSGSSSSTLPDRYSRISLDRAGSEATARRRSLVCLPRGGQVEQLQPGGPALEPPGQLGHVARRERLAVHVGEQPLDLPRAEPQVVVGDLAQRTGHRSRGRFQPGAWRHVAASTSHGGASSTSSPSAASAGEPASSCRSSRARTTRSAATRSSAPAASAPERHPAPRPGRGRDHGGQRLAHVAQQGGLPPVAGVDPVPGRGRGQRRGVLGQQCGLAAARRPGDEHQAVVGGAAERPQQALAGQGPTGGGRMRARGTASSGTSRSAS